MVRTKSGAEVLGTLHECLSSAWVLQLQLCSLPNADVHGRTCMAGRAWQCWPEATDGETAAKSRILSIRLISSSFG